MKGGIRKGTVRKTANPGEGLSLAKEIGTPTKEYKVALAKELSYPAAGLPDYKAMEEELGLSLGMLSGREFLR